MSNIFFFVNLLYFFAFLHFYRFESPMGTHDPKDIDEEVNSSWKLVSHLENEFCDIPAARELVINVNIKMVDPQRQRPTDLRSDGTSQARGADTRKIANPR